MFKVTSISYFILIALKIRWLSEKIRMWNDSLTTAHLTFNDTKDLLTGSEGLNQRQTHNLSVAIKVIIKSQIIRDSKSGQRQRIVPSLFLQLKAFTDLIVLNLILSLRILHYKSFLQSKRDFKVPHQRH